MNKSDAEQLEYFQKTGHLMQFGNSNLILLDKTQYYIVLRTMGSPFANSIFYNTPDVSILGRAGDEEWYESVVVDGRCGNYIVISFRNIIENHGYTVQAEISKKIVSAITDHIKQTEPYPHVRGLRAYDLIELINVIENTADELLNLLDL